MNEEIEYAEMLEIPVSTVSVVRKKRTRKTKTATPTPKPRTQNADLKETVIAQVNDKLEDTPTNLLSDKENEQGNILFDDIPERIDTVRLYSASEKSLFGKTESAYLDDFSQDESENDGGMYATNEKFKQNRFMKIALGVEFALSCVFCGAIFLTNVFMPNSAINTFFRSLTKTDSVAQIDNRTYADFTLSPIVSALSNAQLNLSDTGVITFTDDCCVYTVADGEISAITQNADGSFSVKIHHSNSFTGVIDGLQTVYYEVGDSVKSNIPLGYSDGEREVQVTMYSDGTLLNCMYLTSENCLAWLEE